MSRDIHDQHSAEAAEAWAIQNFNAAISALVEQVDFKSEEHFKRFVFIIGQTAWVKNQTKLEGMTNEEI